MRNLVFALLLLPGFAAYAVASSPFVSQQIKVTSQSGWPAWLVADVLEAACTQSQHFGDMGMETLMLYYGDGTATIDYLGRDAVNPAMGRYRVVAGGGTVVVAITDDL